MAAPRDGDLAGGPPATELIPARPSLAKLREAASDCRACDLYRDATQTVFGERAAFVRDLKAVARKLDGSATRRRKPDTGSG
jgi:DNA polymerase